MKRGGRLGRLIRYWYLRVVRIDDSPEGIARGLAFGVIIGIFPTFGVGVLIVWFASSYLHVNKAAALLGTLVMNPWTSPFFWAMSYLAGSLMMGYGWDETMGLYRVLKSRPDSWRALLAARLIVPYLIGNILITAGCAWLSYLAAVRAARSHLETKKRKRLERQGLK